MKIRTITELQNDDFLNQKELAKLLNKSTRTLQNWRESGILPSKRMGNSIFFHWGTVKKALMSGDFEDTVSVHE
jgi:phage terminase Nu1 subunit (DNA packaging protein)